MRRPGALFIPLLLALLAGPAFSDIVRIAPSRVAVGAAKIRPLAAPPKTGPGKLDKAGPVSSPDPYFTLTLGDAQVYRDALDRTLAYYRPDLKLGTRAGTPLAEGVGELASTLDGFLFKYYRFESGGVPKWGNMQAIVVAARPEEATLEAVQRSWPEVTRLRPLPLKLDASAGVRMILPYPARIVRFSQLISSGGTEDLQWYCFGTNTHPTPADLLSDSDSDILNETKVRDFASLISSDLTDMPSFRPVLEVTATYPGWQGASPLSRAIFRVPAGLSMIRMNAPAAQPSATTQPGAVTPRRIPRILRFSGMSLQPIARGAVRVTPDVRVATPGKMVSPTPALRQPIAIRPDLIQVIGKLSPREDVDYTYSNAAQVTARLPITYTKGKTPNYDYYFLSDSGRFGGPYFEPSTLPERPQRAAAPEGFSGYWYESHSVGKRLVWAAPKQLRLRWEVESGLRPSCRFSLTSGEGGKLTGHIAYDVFPDFSMRQLASLTAAVAKQTGEKVDLLPFTDLLDANQISLAAASPTIQKLAASKQLTVTKLMPAAVDDAWFRVNVDMPVDDWATFTLFMKLGELGSWDLGVLTGASSGVAEKVSFQLSGDLLQPMGGPVVATKKSYDPATGGYEVTFDNYGLAPLEVKGLRFALTGEQQTSADVWFDGSTVALPGVGSASSFDQRDGAGGSITATAKADASADLKALTDTGKYQNLQVQLTPEMIAPSSAGDAAGGADPDILFSFVRSLCYQYIGSSEIISVPVSPAELSQWSGYKSGSIVLRFQGFVYTKQLDLAAANKVDMRRIPREGAYAAAGKPGDADLLEYRAVFAKSDGTIVSLPPQTEGESRWLTGDITGVTLDMTQAH